MRVDYQAHWDEGIKSNHQKHGKDYVTDIAFRKSRIIRLDFHVIFVYDLV
jgi:hypothetical protein